MFIFYFHPHISSVYFFGGVVTVMMSQIKQSLFSFAA